ncbi:MAG: hypothetical protein HY951_08985 [Bacteroidia bacterium]|nr:hypothetical protein [Bacteroidia bacterium]
MKTKIELKANQPYEGKIGNRTTIRVENVTEEHITIKVYNNGDSHFQTFNDSPPLHLLELPIDPTKNYTNFSIECENNVIVYLIDENNEGQNQEDKFAKLKELTEAGKKAALEGAFSIPKKE